VVEAARFMQAFTFQYSIRPGTPAAEMENQIPKEVVQERYERLGALQDQISWEENTQQVGTLVNVLVANHEGRKDDATNRLSGRAEDGRLVHFSVPDSSAAPRPGDVVSVVVTEAKPFFLLADGHPEGGLSIRRTRSGDAWDRWQTESCGAPTSGTSLSAVSLGMPALKVPGHS
jgi:tRNA-2-methylthio-N6-dimethylallyladenosine synthase